jgi:hypothetical protein
MYVAEQEPDYTRIVKALNFKEGDRLPPVELMVDLPVQERFAGGKITSVDDEIEFYLKAGYDYFCQKFRYEFPGIPLFGSWCGRLDLNPLTRAESSNSNHISGPHDSV